MPEEFDNGLDDQDINGEIIMCTDGVSMVEIITPLDTMQSAALTFSHLYHYFNSHSEDVQVVAVNVAYRDIEGVTSMVTHVLTTNFD